MSEDEMSLTMLKMLYAEPMNCRNLQSVVKDIIADLLDDGKLNRSAGEDTEDKKDFLDKAQEQAEKLKTLFPH